MSKKTTASAAKKVKVDMGDHQVILPSILDIPYTTYKVYRNWLKTWMKVEVSKTKDEETVERFEAETDALIDTLMTSIKEYGAVAKNYSYNQHIQILVKWVGIEAKTTDPEKLGQALETLGK